MVLTGCASIKRTDAITIDCAQPGSTCHEGRFGLTYRLQKAGQTEEDAVNGSYRWESLNNPTGQVQVSSLMLSTVLGTSLAHVEQSPGRIVLTDNKGEQHLSRDWNALFKDIFQVPLPGQAIAQWMADGARTDTTLPALPAPWVWEASPRRLRLSSRTADGFIRVDLLPTPATAQ